MQILTKLLTSLIGVVVPRVSAAVVELIFETIFGLVAELQKKDAPGSAKLAAALEVAHVVLDEFLDGVPGWEKLTEERRDQILTGVIELAVIIVQATEEASADDLPKLPGGIKQAAKQARIRIQEIDLDHVLAEKIKAQAKPKAKAKASAKAKAKAS